MPAHLRLLHHELHVDGNASLRRGECNHQPSHRVRPHMGARRPMGCTSTWQGLRHDFYDQSVLHDGTTTATAATATAAAGSASLA